MNALHNRRVSGTADTMNFILIGAAIVGAYFLFKKLGSGTLTAGGQNNAGINSSSASTSASDLASAQAKGISQTIPDTTLNGYATTLYQLLGNAADVPMSDTDFGNIYTMIANVQNDADWYRLVQLFGTKQFNSGGWLTSCALSGGLLGCDSYDLVAALRAALSATQVSVINNYFLYRQMSAQI
jgi:hypothetical protein